MGKVLYNDGHEVNIANDREELLTHLPSRRFDLILLLASVPNPTREWWCNGEIAADVSKFRGYDDDVVPVVLVKRPGDVARNAREAYLASLDSSGFLWRRQSRHMSWRRACDTRGRLVETTNFAMFWNTSSVKNNAQRITEPQWR